MEKENLSDRNLRRLMAALGRRFEIERRERVKVVIDP
jgi:hypothetical protein